MAAAASMIRVAPTEDGCCVRVDGRGTMAESPSAEAVAMRTLGGDPQTRVVFDLSNCDYLDSTFLGCIVHLFREHGAKKPSRFFVAAPPDRRKKLLGACRLDMLIPSLDAAPAAAGEWVQVPACPLGSKDLARHIMQCHKLLAELDSPMRQAFAKIAEQLARELDKPSGVAAQ